MKKINKKFKNIFALTMSASILPIVVSCSSSSESQEDQEIVQLKADINAYIIKLNTQTKLQYTQNLNSAKTKAEFTRLKTQVSEYWTKVLNDTKAAIDKITDNTIKAQLTTEYNGYKDSKTSTESNFDSVKKKADEQYNKEQQTKTNLGNDTKTPPSGDSGKNNDQQAQTDNPQEVAALKTEIRNLIQQLPDDNRNKTIFTLRLNFNPNINKAQLEKLKTEVQNELNSVREASQDTTPVETRNFSFSKITQQQAIEKLKNRSFSVGFGFKEKSEQVYDNYTGTAWLFDYAFDQNKQNIVLFLATNLHVYNRQTNTLSEQDKAKFPEYGTNEDSKNTNFFLGVPQTNINTNPIPNNTTPSLETNRPKLYSNLPDSVSDKQGSTSIGDILGNPQTVFAAIDIFDSASNSQLKRTAAVAPGSEYTDQKLGFDFAIFAVEIKYSQLSSTTHKELKEHIDNAIKSFDDDIKILKHDQDTLYIPFDYATSYNENQRRNLKPERIYIGGYPKVSNTAPVFMTNTSTDLDHTITYERNTFSNNLVVNPVFDSKRATVPFGYSFNVKNSSLYYGASGSMVLNEYGVPVGIYSTVENTESPSDLSKRGGFIQLILTKDAPGTSYAYNLIDGSDKTKTPKQEKSYRQNLGKLSSLTAKYPKTALFPEGIIKR